MHDPVDSRDDHESSSSPGQPQELISNRRRQPNIIADVVDLVDTLLPSHSDENAGDKEYKCGEPRKNDVDGVDAATSKEEECAGARDHGEAGETHCQDVEDECNEESRVEKIDRVLDVIGPVDVSKTQLEGTDGQLLVKHLGEVEAFYKIRNYSQSALGSYSLSGAELVHSVTLYPAPGLVALGLYCPSHVAMT
jgi:hypothetical protein